MEVHVLFLQLTVILLAARVTAEVAARLGAPPVIGELVAGVILGPNVLGWVAPEHAIKLLAEIGIILLLFEVGLETDAASLVRTGRASLVVALFGLVLPFGLGYVLAHHAFGLGLLPSLFVGGTLTATSIGVTVRVLSDLGRQQSGEGGIVLGAAVLDDVMGVVLLALLYEFSVGGGVSPANAGKVVVFIALFFALATPAAKAISAVIDRFDTVSPIPGLIPTTIVSLVLFFAWLAHAVGRRSCSGASPRGSRCRAGSSCRSAWRSAPGPSSPSASRAR